MCVVCGNEFVQRSNRQKACRDCRAATPGHQPLGTERTKPVEELPCAGPEDAGALPCPHGKTVRKMEQARGPLRCPDCHLGNKRRMVRRRLPELRQEQKDLRARIDQSAPPPAPPDLEDAKAEEDDTMLSIDDDTLDDDVEEELDEDAAAAEEVLPSRPRHYERLENPKLRQLQTSAPGRGPAWWVGKGREDFKKAVTERLDTMRTSREARTLKGQVNFV